MFDKTKADWSEYGDRPDRQRYSASGTMGDVNTLLKRFFVG